MIGNIIAILGVMIMIVVLFAFGAFIGANSQFIKDGNIAKRGFILSNTSINLDNYKLIGNGEHHLFGTYELYTRSERHESIAIYNNSNKYRDWIIEQCK